MTNKKILELIESMAILWNNGDTENSSRTETIMNSIYKCAHIGGNGCGNLHEDWQEEAQKLYDSLKSGR